MLAAFVIIVKEDLTEHGKERESIEVCDFRGISAYVSEEGRHGGGRGFVCGILCYIQAHCVAKDDLAQISLPPSRITDICHHA